MAGIHTFKLFLSPSIRSSSTSFSTNQSFKGLRQSVVLPYRARFSKFLHVKPGKGAAFVRTKMRNYVTGNTVEKTFRAGVTTTYEEFRLNEADVGDKTKWLKEGMDCNLQFWNGKAIDLEVPLLVKLTVVDTDPGVKGDSAQGGTKPATLDTEAVVNVPFFVNIGDSIVVGTRTGQYTSHA
ncbi:uncharacterized protein LOC130827842 [Amaranthus tricolor]|uniref:uncharacterized protein LOC130827842 n=1 Tax=Amaranthus tricolor TaxID=29722 RepID=UPI00258890CC|nr:uncharacterized protein LOC130827842 [Amaranthus tricolor]